MGAMLVTSVDLMRLKNNINTGQSCRQVDRLLSSRPLDYRTPVGAPFVAHRPSCAKSGRASRQIGRPRRPTNPENSIGFVGVGGLRRDWPPDGPPLWPPRPPLVSVCGCLGGAGRCQTRPDDAGRRETPQSVGANSSKGHESSWTIECLLCQPPDVAGKKGPPPKPFGFKTSDLAGQLGWHFFHFVE